MIDSSEGENEAGIYWIGYRDGGAIIGGIPMSAIAI
jgi:hypothetical protein